VSPLTSSATPSSFGSWRGSERAVPVHNTGVRDAAPPMTRSSSSSGTVAADETDLPRARIVKLTSSTSKRPATSDREPTHLHNG